MLDSTASTDSSRLPSSFTAFQEVGHPRMGADRSQHTNRALAIGFESSSQSQSGQRGILQPGGGASDTLGSSTAAGAARCEQAATTLTSRGGIGLLAPGRSIQESVSDMDDEQDVVDTVAIAKARRAMAAAHKRRRAQVEGR